jgi:hypothetical protein
MVSRITLVRLVLVVSAIAAALVWAVHYWTRCHTDGCRRLALLEEVVHIYVLETGTLPDDLHQLTTRLGPGDLPIAKPAWLMDQWGHPVQYARTIGSKRSFRLTILAARHQADGQGPSEDIIRKVEIERSGR